MPAGRELNSDFRPFRYGVNNVPVPKPLSTRTVSFTGQVTGSTRRVLPSLPSSVMRGHRADRAGHNQRDRTDPDSTHKALKLAVQHIGALSRPLL